MKLSPFPVLVRLSPLLVLLGGIGACSSGPTGGSGGAGTGGATGGAGTGGATGGAGTGGRGGAVATTGGAGGRGGSGGAASCTVTASATANFAFIKDVIGHYCGGAGCHNENQAPNLFPGNDATLYRTLTEYKVAKCGNRVLVKPCAPDESAFYRSQTEPTSCSPLPRMPFGCGTGSCTDSADLADIRQWIVNGAPK